MVDKGAEEAIDAGVRNRGTFHLSIDARNDVLLVEHGLRKGAGQTALKGKQESLQVDAIVKTL